jgi:hypothetical protein
MEVAWADVPIEPELFRSPGVDELAGVDQRECVGTVAALKIDRLVVGPSIVTIWRGFRLTRTRAAEVMPVSASVLS